MFACKAGPTMANARRRGAAAPHNIINTVAGRLNVPNHMALYSHPSRRRRLNQCFLRSQRHDHGTLLARDAGMLGAMRVLHLTGMLHVTGMLHAACCLCRTQRLLRSLCVSWTVHIYLIYITKQSNFRGQFESSAIAVAARPDQLARLTFATR